MEIRETISMASKNISKLIFVFAVFFLIFVPFNSTAFAEDSSLTDATSTSRVITITLRSGSSVIWSGSVSVPDSDSATTTIAATDGISASVLAASALAALISADAAQTEFSVSNLQYFSSFGSFYLKCITATAEFCDNWQYVVNGTYPSSGMDQYILHDGDSVHIYFGTQRRFSLSSSETIPTIPVTVNVESYNYADDSWSPLSGEIIGATTPNPADPFNPIVATTTISGADGNALLALNENGTYNVGLASDYYSTTTSLLVRSLASNEVILRIRNGADLAYQGIVTISSATTSILATDGSAHDVSGSTPLAVLNLADQTSDTFNISELQYFSSFSSFYIKCITLSDFACDNWQYAVNGTVPGVGADAYTLSGGENLFFFYGYPRRVSLSSASITKGSSVTATSETYEPSDDSYIPVTGFTIGVTQPNPTDSFNPIEIVTSTVDANGQAVFSVSDIGTYQVGIKEDFYFPTTDLSVTEAAESTPVIVGGGAPSVIHRAADVGKAIQFLLTHQLENGSFGPLLYTDWAAIALVANGSPTAKVADYLKSANSGMSVATDYERHAMALMALGINPYTGTSVNYIQKITDAFDGTQIGDKGLVNDDIFSLFPLLKAGYSANDPMIAKIISFILSKQSANGSWESSIDLTAAGIQALSLNTAIDGVTQAISKARTYLESHQNSDGGFGTSFSTSWALQAIASIGEFGGSWLQNNSNPYDYLYALQADDGGIENASVDLNSRIWATSYAIPASLNKTWDSLLAYFSKPAASAVVSSVGGGASVGSTSVIDNLSASTTASTTISTTTFQIETITPSSTAITASGTEPSPKIAPASNETNILANAVPIPKINTTTKENNRFVQVASSSKPLPPVANKETGPKTQANSSGLANIANAVGANIIN
ncbi:MAG: DUF4430 domain-containing protein, partial [Candidatus Yanofskybacteria bacterium]|nr:DUF4430 domain-containing protein [Candidatus Yanofskybacteria bacterium]